MDTYQSSGIILNLFGNQYVIHDTVFYSWVIVLILSLFAIYVGSKVKKVEAEETPTGIVNLMEMAVSGVNNFVASTMGGKNLRYAPYIFTLAMFLIPANLLGLLGFTPPTSDFNVTLALGMITFLLIQAKAISSKGGLGGYLKGFVEPTPILLPINILGEIATPISLSFRLFGNVLAGVIIMSLLYSALGFLSPVVAPVLHAYFDIFSGLLQTFIFAMLTMVQIAMAE